MAILVYGAEKADKAPQGPSTTQSAGIVGGEVSQGLNKAISGVTGSDFISVRVDTSRAADPRSEVAFQVARDLSIQYQRLLQAPVGGNLDKQYVSVNWRFRRNWSWETTVGDKASTFLDLIWERRY